MKDYKQPNKESSRHTSYYKRKYAEQVKKLVAPLLGFTLEELQTKQVVLDCLKYRKRPETIRQLLHWGWQWLIEFGDATGIYLELRKNVAVTRVGHQIFIRGRRPDEELEGELVDFIAKHEAATEGWQADLINFIEEAPEGEQFYRWHRLTAHHLLWISDYLAGLLDQVAVLKIGPSGFHIVKNRMMARQQNLELLLTEKEK